MRLNPRNPRSTFAEFMNLRFAGVNDINTICTLAEKIWPATYEELLTKDQVNYMMNWIYSPASLEEQIVEKKHQFLILEEDERPVGFASYSTTPEPHVFKLHKIYVLPDQQGKGLGKYIIDFITEKIRTLGANALQLNVKRDNNARFFYEKLGFYIVEEVDIDIGNNYFMRDYIMEKKV